MPWRGREADEGRMLALGFVATPTTRKTTYYIHLLLLVCRFPYVSRRVLADSLPTKNSLIEGDIFWVTLKSYTTSCRRGWLFRVKTVCEFVHFSTSILGTHFLCEALLGGIVFAFFRFLLPASTCVQKKKWMRMTLPFLLPSSGKHHCVAGN